jgi:hypothetical protein
MLKNALFAVSALALVMAAPSLALAKSTGHTVTPPSRAEACTGKAPGTEVDVDLKLPNDKTVTITFHCGTDDTATDDNAVAGTDDPGDDNGQDSTTFRDGKHPGQGNGGQDNSAPDGDGKSDDAPGHNGGEGGGDDGGTD